MSKTEVHSDYHILASHDFGLLIGYPLKNFFKKNYPMGALKEEFGKTTSAMSISHLENPMAKHHPNHDLFKEDKFTSLFISPKLCL